MLKDLFATVLCLLIVFAGLLQWNGFWREYLAGKVYHKLGKIEEAIGHYEKALGESSHGIIKEAELTLRQEILALKGRFNWKTSDTFLRALIRMTMDKPGQHPQSIVEAGQTLYDLLLEYTRNKSSAELQTFATRIDQINSNSSLASLALGEAYLLDGNLAEAVKSYEASLDKEPFYERGLIKLVEIFQKEDKYQDIIRVAEPHKEKVKPSFTFLSILGKAYYLDRQLQMAISPLQAGLEIKPKDLSSLILLGRIGLALDEPVLVENLNTAWSLDGKRLDLLEKWLKFQLQVEKYDQVIDFFKKNRRPEEQFQLIEMEALVKAKNFAQFESFLTQTTLKSESHPEITYFHGVMAMESGNDSLAEEKLKEFLRSSGITGNQKRKTLEYLIQIYKRSKRVHLERSYLRQLMQLVPSLSKVHLAVGETYEREGNTKKALKTYLAALELFPTSTILLQKACAMLIEKEAFFKVTELLTDIKITPEKVELPLFLTRAFLGIYDYSAARRIINRLTLIPDGKVVIPDDLLFLLEESAERLAPPAGFEENLEALQQQEKSFLAGLKDSELEVGPGASEEVMQRYSLSRFIQRSDFSGMGLEEFKKMTNLLLENGANSKVIEILYGKEDIHDDSSLAFTLVRAMIQEYDYFGARSVLNKAIASARNLKDIPADLKFLTENELPSSGMTDEEIRLRITKLRDEEEKFLASLSEYSGKFAKNALPPDPDQSKKLILYGMLRSDHTYRGNGEVFIPEGRSISLLDVLSDEQREILTKKEGRLPFFLCQYGGKLHQIDSKYIEVLEPPEGEKLGLGKISNVDLEYSARAELEKNFRFGERVEILESTVHDRDQVILFNNESYASFFALPKEGFKIKVQAEVFHNFSKEALKLEPQYEFLRNEIFSDIYEIPGESKVVLFGPEGGGVTLFAKDTNGIPLLMHQIKIHEMVKSIPRYERNFSRINYLGAMIIDVNNDNTLDYLTLWRSHLQSNRALIHAAVSNAEGKFRDFLVPTDISFIPEHQFKPRISLLNFLRDSDLDGHLEILVYRPFSVISGESYQIPWFEIFQIEKDNLVNTSKRFPEFYADQGQSLRNLRKKKEESTGSKLQYQSWLAGYLKVMARLGEYSGAQ